MRINGSFPPLIHVKVEFGHEPVLARQPPEGPEWSHEIKFDGWRFQAIKDGHGVRLFSRRGFDITGKIPDLARELDRLPATDAIIDAELLAIDELGRCDFWALRQTLNRRADRRLVIRACDLLHIDGQDVRGQPLSERRRRLKRIVTRRRIEPLLFSEALAVSGEELLALAEMHGLEGIVSKQIDAPYRSGKYRSWVKTKTDTWRMALVERKKAFRR